MLSNLSNFPGAKRLERFTMTHGGSQLPHSRSILGICCVMSLSTGQADLVGCNTTTLSSLKRF